MDSKLKNRQIYLFILLFIMWGLYYIQSFRLFSEVKELTTLGGAYVVRLLEFTNFRGEQLFIILIEYFILISITLFLSQFLYKKSNVDERNSILIRLIIINSFFVITTCILANIFWSVYVVLFIVSILIITASVYVSGIFFDNLIEYSKGDIVYSSDAFETEKEARTQLKKQFSKLDKSEISKLSGEVFNIEEEFFYEIYTNEKIILDNKGDFITYEKT